MALPSMKQFKQEIDDCAAALARGNGTAPDPAKSAAPSVRATGRAPGRSMSMNMTMGMKPS